ncbi:hypothetical protein [Laceyella putida]|uniref:Bacteriocin immunity protein n=1 Tax=Laceyella putida TaxID=110101 RepID=A0ABW2RR12_9BACL
MTDKNEKDTFNQNVSVGRDNYGQISQGKNIHIQPDPQTKKKTELIVILQEIKNVAESDTFPAAARDELVPLLLDAQRSLNSSQPEKSRVQKALEVANRYNSFFGAGALLTSALQLINDIFGG